MLALRPYQRDAIEAVAMAYRRGVRRHLISLPTGTGKTVVFANVTNGASLKDRRTIILAHTDELIGQAHDKLLAVAPDLAMSVGIVKAKRDEWGSPVTIASIQSLHQRRLDRWEAEGVPKWDVLICDEAHHAAADSYRRFMEWAGCFDATGAPLSIGVTATPERSDKKQLGKVWEEVVYHRDILSMIREGYLCNLTGIQVRLKEFDANALHTRAGDFIDSEAGEALSAADAPRHTVAAWLVHASQRKTLVFTPTVALAHEMADSFKERGVAAAALSGQTPMDERRAILAHFAAGRIRVVCNAQLLTEGFDEPSIECIVIAKPTKQRSPYIQMVGRGTRLHPGKVDCLIMDIVGVTTRLDLTTLIKLVDEDEVLRERDPNKPVDLLGVAAEVDAKRKEGHLVVSQVELFSRQAFNWQMAKAGMWALDLGGETIIVALEGDRWGVTTYGKDGSQVSLAQGLDLGYAMGVAEEHARKAKAGSLIDKNAAWRKKPATPGQLDAARKWKLKVSPQATRGEVNDLLNIKIATARHRRARRVHG